MRAHRPSPCGCSARISVGETPRPVTRWRSTSAQSRSTSGIIGGAVVEQQVAPQQQRAQDLPRAHHPAHVGDPVQACRPA